MFEFFDGVLIGDGELVLLIFKFVDGTFEFVVFVFECEIVVVLLEDGILVDVVVLSEYLSSRQGLLHSLLFIIYHQLLYTLYNRI